MRLLATAAVLALIGSAGCQTSPFYNDYPRTPYERYQLLRGNNPPQTEYDSYGNPRPALRARLTPPDRR